MFLTKLDFLDADGNTDILTKPLIFHSEKYGQIVVPSGFEIIFSPSSMLHKVYLWFGGQGVRSALVHHYLRKDRKISRALAGKIYYDALKAEGAPLIVRVAMFLGVRFADI